MIIYKSGYKYLLHLPYALEIDLHPPVDIETDYIGLDVDGTLDLRAGYAWDGPSGPALDTRNFMRGSLVHDALYQLMREGYLDAALYRRQADAVLRTLCRADGMSAPRAWWVYWGVRLFGASSAARGEGSNLRQAP